MREVTTKYEIGIQSLKAFLDGFSTPESDNATRISILKDYLESQKPSDVADKAAVYLPDLMQTWSFASQSNDESLLSAVPAVLALLLRTISNILELTEYGSQLSRTLLQKRQQELMARGLKSNKTREFLISPVLRLLKELSTFDGGAFAKLVFRARDHVFQNLPRNLNLRYNGDDVEDRKRPSVRTNALRFVLSLLKFLTAEAKRELLNQQDIVSNLTKDIKDDPPFIVRDILEALKAHVLKDEALIRGDKTKLVNASFLSRVAMLYRYDQPDENASETKKSVDIMAHEFLLLACTTPGIGVLNRQDGFYPRGFNLDHAPDIDVDQTFIDLGIDSIEMDKYTDKVPVRNTILSEFIQNLRPWSSAKQSELLLSILRAAPELVAEYFFSKKAFAFDPKLTATWIGYSAFIFSAIQLPIPKYFGHNEGYTRLPPPASIVLENIIPQPLTQKVLRTCLIQPHSLVSFFAVRLLCIALSKLQDILRMYQEAASGPSSIWTQAAERLTNKFCQRCPSMKDVIFAFRKTTEKDLMQREAFTKLLVLYYEVIPRIALDAKFDVSEALAKALQALEESTLTPQDRVMRVMELENLFKFAHFSPGTRWFSKMQDLPLSPFMTMLKISAEAPPDVPLLRQRSVLDSVAEENQVLQNQTSISALDSFVLALRPLLEDSNASAVYKFLDDCVSRCVVKPIKYIFALEEIYAGVHESNEKQSPVSLLALAIVEQWPFWVKSATNVELPAIARFVARYMAMSIKIKEDKKAIKSMVQKLVTETPEGSPARKILEKSRKLADDVVVPEARIKHAEVNKGIKSNAPSEPEKAKITEAMLEVSDAKSEDHSSLTKWTTKDVDEVIEDGYAAALIMLLSSQHLSVRKEAVTNLAKLAAKLKESSFEEKDQIWLLLCEITETARQIINEESLPTFISTFASRAIAVLNDPLHCLYAKVNTFLSKGPIWDLAKIPLMYKILDEPPSLDDTYYKETSWLLAYMLAGLRTEADMSVYRKRKVFEKLFSTYNSPYLDAGLRDKILRILFKATTIEGGSTTLITRFSTMTWLQAQVALGGGMPLKVLMERILESGDQKRVKSWSKNSAKGVKSDTVNFA